MNECPSRSLCALPSDGRKKASSTAKLPIVTGRTLDREKQRDQEVDENTQIILRG